MYDKEQGFTLIEIIASLVIITLLLTSFLSLLISSAQSTQRSKEVIDYTLIAQTELEALYSFAQNDSLSNQQNVLTNQMDFTLVNTSAESSLYEKQTSDVMIQLTASSYESTGTFQTLEDSLSNVVVEIQTLDTSTTLAKMESIIEWRASP